MTESLQGYVLLLYSRLNGLVNIFQLSVSSVSPSHAVVAFDPYAISLSSAHVTPYHSSSSGAATQDQSSISCVALQPAPHKYRVFDDVSTSDPDVNDLTEGISFYNLFILRSDLSICECVYVGRSGKEFDGSRVFALSRLSRTRSQKSTALTTEVRMIVSEDGEGFAMDQVGKLVSEEKNVARQHKQTPIPKPDHNPADHWTVNSEFLYRLVTEPRSTKSLTMSSLTLDEQDRQLSPELVREMLDRKYKSGASGIKSL